VHADVIEILRWMGLISKAAAVPALLSGGDVQKVMIARAVIGRPRLLLADQPTAGLDFYQSERIIHLLRELNRLGSTVLIATNDVSQAERHPGPTLLLAHNSLIEID
jgi:cell division transport system ATP-binding protein